jgi:Domain of unknown function (DUF4157)
VKARAPLVEPAKAGPARGMVTRQAARPVRFKLEVGAVNDPVEHEAERVARRVLRQPTGERPARCACGGTPGPDGLCAACRAKLARAAAGPAPVSAPRSVDTALTRPGAPLDRTTRTFFEPRLGLDLSGVRVHDDAAAHASAADVAAHAYTVGTEIVFAAGRYRPASESGRELLAHELAHVAQHGDGVLRRKPAQPVQQRMRVPITVVVNEEIDGPEFRIRAIMQTFHESREAAIARIAAQHWTFYGPHSVHGVHGEWVGRPITFWAGMQPLSEQEAAEMAQRRSQIDPAERDVLFAAVDEEFWQRAGQIRILGKGAADRELRRLYLQVLDEHLREREGPPPPPDPIQEAIDGIQTALTSGEITDDKTLVAAFDLQRQLVEEQSLASTLSPLDRLRLARRMPPPGKGVTDWVATLKRIGPTSRESEFHLESLDTVKQLIAEQARLKAATDRLRGLGGLYAAITHYESAPSGVLGPMEVKKDTVEVDMRALERQHEKERRREAMEASLAAANFKDVADFDKAAGAFREEFQGYAVEVAQAMLTVSERILSETSAYRVHITDPARPIGEQVPQITRDLFAELQRSGGEPSKELLDRHRILMDEDTLKEALKADSPLVLASRIGYRAAYRATQLAQVRERIKSHPDVVLNWDVVVNETLKEMKLTADPVFAELIASGRGKEGRSLWSWLIEAGLVLLSLAAGPFGWGARLALATWSVMRGAETFGQYFNEKEIKEIGFRTTDPSTRPLYFAGLDIALNLFGLGRAPGAVGVREGAAQLDAQLAAQAEKQLAKQAGREATAVAGQAGREATGVAGQAGREAVEQAGREATEQAGREAAGQAEREAQQAAGRAAEEPLPVEPKIDEPVLATEPIPGTRHKVTVSESGVIYRCSPRCDRILDLLDQYRGIFAGDERFVARLQEVEDLVDLVRRARAAGIPEAKTLANQVADHAAQLLHDVERSAAIQRDMIERGAMATLEEGGALAHPLGDLYPLLSEAERMDIGAAALRLAEGKTAAAALRAENNLAGHIREIAAKYHPDVANAVRDAAHAADARGMQFVDSATAGVVADIVELPGRLRGNDRFIRLGTDRVAGPARIAPHDVPVFWSDGTSGVMRVEGELEVSLAVEIKGRTTAVEGIGQIRALADRGSRGYAIIGNKLWLLKYNPAQAMHIVVAAPGYELRQAAELAAELSRQGVRTQAVAIGTALDDDIKALARHLLEEAAAAAQH